MLPASKKPSINTAPLSNSLAISDEENQEDPSSLIEPIETIEEEIFEDALEFHSQEPATKQEVVALTLILTELKKLISQTFEAIKEKNELLKNRPPPKQKKPFSLQVIDTPKKNNRKYTPIGTSYTNIFKMLFENGKIQPLEPRPFESPKRIDKYYCSYHQSGGHTIEQCFKFKDLVQRLIDEKKLVQLPQDAMINGVWDSDDEDVYLKDIEETPLSTIYPVSDIWDEEDSPIDVLTRSGRVQPPISTQPIPSIQQIPVPIIEDNDVVKQLKKTKVEMNVWKLLATS